jgi:ABC-2 type transport system ATP-binding protein
MPSSGPRGVLELVSVSVVRAGREILHDVSVRAEAGDAVAVTGANGAGKTTLLRTIAGVDEPATGRIIAGGAAVEPNSAHRHDRVSFCPDAGLVIDELTTGEHLRLAALLFGASADQAERRAGTVALMLGLSRYASYRGAELSFGLARRLSIGVAIARDADLFLFDEPWTGLDAEGVAAVQRVLNRLRRSRRTVLVAGHGGPYLVGVANRVWHLEAGGVHIGAGAAAEAMPAAPLPAAAEVASPPQPRSARDGELPWLT